MKKTLKLFSLFTIISVVAFFTACDEVTDLADVKFDANLSKDVDVTSASETLKGDSLYSFEGSELIDPREDDDINKYWDLIKSWEIKKVVITIKSIDEPAHLDNMELSLVDNNTQDSLFSYSVNNVELEEGTKVLEVNQADWNNIINALNEKHKIMASLSGAVEKPSLNIVFKVSLSTKITANPL